MVTPNHFSGESQSWKACRRTTRTTVLCSGTRAASLLLSGRSKCHDSVRPLVPSQNSSHFRRRLLCSPSAVAGKTIGPPGSPLRHIQRYTQPYPPPPPHERRRITRSRYLPGAATGGDVDSLGPQTQSHKISDHSARCRSHERPLCRPRPSLVEGRGRKGAFRVRRRLCDPNVSGCSLPLTT